MFAIRNVRIETVTRGRIDDGTVLVDDGRILAVGEDVDVPADCAVVDGEGGWLYPGLIDAHCHAGVTHEASSTAWIDGNEFTSAVTPQLDALDSLCPEDLGMERACFDGGVTMGAVSPGSSNVFGGQIVASHMAGSLIADELVVMRPCAMKMAFGENPTNNGRSAKRLPSTRMGVAAVVRETLTATRGYMEKKARAAEKGDPFDVDLKHEALAKVLAGTVPAHCHAHAAEDMVTAIRLAEEFGYRCVIIHGTDAYRIADYLAEKKVPVILGPTSSMAAKHENRRRSFDAIHPLLDAGVTVCLSTDHPIVLLRDLRFEAVKVIERGVPEAKALEMLTIEPARVLGLEGRLGSIETGKDADLVLWSGSIFDPARSSVRRVFIGGVEMKRGFPVLVDDPRKI